MDISAVDSESLSDAPQRPRWDRELILRFARRRDERAFAELVSRHGPLVLAVCRRVLPNEQDAMDAFQATFLVLAQKAARVRWNDSLANWLYGVAYRCSRKAAARIGSRREEQLDCDETIAHHAFSEICSREAQRTLLEQLDRLPSRYRSPLILCYLEGKTQEEAGRDLGCSTAAIKGRLRRGRQRLRRQLALRGVVLSFAIGTMQRSLEAAGAAVTETLIAATTEASVACVGGGGGAESVSPDVIELTKGGAEIMKVTTWVGGVAAAALACVAVTWCVHSISGASLASPQRLKSEAPADSGGEEATMPAAAITTNAADADDNVATALRATEEALLTAAKDAYVAARASYRAGVRTWTLDAVFYWSRRWMEAELAVSREKGDELRIIQAHVDRMKQLHAEVRAKYEAGHEEGSAKDEAAARFFYLEAKLLLLRARAGKRLPKGGSSNLRPTASQ